jgi:hypothetical protein
MVDSGASGYTRGEEEEEEEEEEGVWACCRWRWAEDI